MASKIRKGDLVQVTAGKDKGKQGKVLLVVTETGKIVVEGANKAVRHLPKRGNTPGQKVESEKPLSQSSVMLVDPTDKKPTRVGFREEDGKKVRFSKRTGKAL